MKQMSKLLVVFSCVISLFGCATNTIPVNVSNANLYKYTGEVSSAGIIEASDTVEIDGFIRQSGRAYVAAVDGVQVWRRFEDFKNALQIQAGQHELVLRYFDGTTVQCQVKIPVTIEANTKYKVVLQSDRGRENIKMTIKNYSNSALLHQPVMAERLQHPFNFATIIPLGAPTFRSQPGCY